MNEYWLAAPEIFLAGAICLVLLVDVYLRQEQRQVTYVLAMLSLVGAALVSVLVIVEQPQVTFSGSFIINAPARIIGSDKSMPIVSQSPMTKPMCASGSRKYSAMKRNIP